MATTELPPAPVRTVRRRPRSPREWLAPGIPGSAPLSWIGPLLVTALAGILRFYRLGQPDSIVFDETYYAKDAWSLLHFGWERNTVENADKMLAADPNADIWAQGAAFVAHPPFGKWMIAVGEWMFGMTPVGWRFMPALIGTLSVLILCRVARRMTGSTLLGCAAGLLLAVDGLHFVTSRAALLDIFVMFWILAGFACLVNDRDRTRRRLAEEMERGHASPYGPFLVHGWRFGAGICLGLAVAVKWTGLFYIAVFGIMVVLWDYGARRKAGVRRPMAGALLLESVPAFAQLVLVAVVTYVATWWGWIFRSGGWGRGEVASSVFLRPFEAIPDLWHYHAEILSFHTGLDSEHPYQSWPWGWPILKRPVAFFYNEPQGACGVGERCSREILGIGTPALWWGALAALVALVFVWLIMRDWRAGAIVAGFLAGWVSWFPSAFGNRTMFLFYATPLIPFMVLAVVLVLGYLIGPARSRPADARPIVPYGDDPHAGGGGAHTPFPDGRPRATAGPRRLVGAAAAGAFVLVVIANFAYFYPILSAETITYQEWHARIWLSSWV